MFKQPPSTIKHLPSAPTIPNFIPDLSQAQNPVPTLGLALINKDQDLQNVVSETPATNIFHALDAQLEAETRIKLQEQRVIEDLANRQRLKENEQSRINRVRQEESFRNEQQRNLEGRVNNQRLREIKEQRAIEFQEAQRLKNSIEFHKENVGSPEHIDERNRFSAHIAIANSFRKMIPAKPKTLDPIVIGLSSYRFQNRPEPVDAV